MRRRRFLPVLLGALAAALPHLAAAGPPTVTVAALQGEVDAISASYLDAAVQHAGDTHASALVVEMDTPGGLGSAMDDIIEHILASRVPVIVYVAPAGARDDSAGLYISQAADVLAMSPATNIGSAHPVLLDTSGQPSSGGGVEDQKVLNDAVARVRFLATLHHRNADWAEQAVRQSVNISAEDAVRLHVADLEAASLAALLTDLDGRTLTRGGHAVTLATRGAAIDEFAMAWPQAALQQLISPDVAYLLLLLAIVGIGVELFHPGVILPGVAGGIAGVLALVALYGLSANLAGLLLILFAVALFVLDLHANTHGALTAGALVGLVVGSILLFNFGGYGPGLDAWVIAVAALGLAAFFGIVLRKVLQARFRPPQAGGETLVGSVGKARERLDPEGMVFVQGALWQGVAEPPPIPAGAEVRVLSRTGLRLQVAAVAPEQEG